MQAIQTRFLGPTNVKGRRVKAFCAAGSLTLNWDHALNPEDNHINAASALAEKLGWTSKYYNDWYMGELANGETAFVMAERRPVILSVKEDA